LTSATRKRARVLTIDTKGGVVNASTRAATFDVIVIGSGFGGSVAALRLVEKGYKVCVLEAGRRFEDADFAKTSWDVRRFLFAPRLGCFGIQRIKFLRDVVVLAGAGVGGGSLVYANTLYEPKSDNFYRDPQWSHIADWRDELAPHYDQAKRMLGVRPNPTMTTSDLIMREVADELGVGDSFGMAPVGVFFGRDGALEPGVTVPDPYFGGVGPERSGCTECGECMTGCRHNAKNTLLKNYLYLAERAGAEVRASTTVNSVHPEGDGYVVNVHSTGRSARRTRNTLTAEHVIVAAGTWGTQELLHTMKQSSLLPGLSERLGHLTRTNSEALCMASAKPSNPAGHDFHHGVAITSSIHPDDSTHIEPVRYGVGSGFMGLLSTVMTDGGGKVPRAFRWLWQVLLHPLQFLGHYAGIRSWSQRTIIALVMQTHDNSLTVFGKKRVLGGRTLRLSSRQGHGGPNPTWIPVANEAVRSISKKIDGKPFSTIGEIFNVPMTAHFLGGCVIGDGPETGVLDAYHRVYGHPGLHITDGSAISANIGVNPSLTITAQAERAMSMWPNKGEADTRPPLGAAYERVAAVRPNSPFVPAGAPAALRLPVVVINGRASTHQCAGGHDEQAVS
jgi:cholesterol oxidase